MANPNPKTDHLKATQFKPGDAGKEQANIHRMGGIASGKARRKKASLKRCAERVMTSDIPKKLKQQIEKTYGDLETPDDMMCTFWLAIMSNEICKGNVQAFNAMLKIWQVVDEDLEIEEMEADPLSAALQEIADKL